jgi:hypothetical protein
MLKKRKRNDDAICWKRKKHSKDALDFSSSSFSQLDERDVEMTSSLIFAGETQQQHSWNTYIIRQPLFIYRLVPSVSLFSYTIRIRPLKPNKNIFRFLGWWGDYCLIVVVVVVVVFINKFL